MTSCGHSFCLQCIRPMTDQFLEEWNCPLCQTPQTVSPQQMSRNYTLEQVLQSLSLNDQQEKIDRAQHKLNVIVETMIVEMTDLQLKINELIEKQPDQFTGKILTRDFLFQGKSSICFVFPQFFISVPVWINVQVNSRYPVQKHKKEREDWFGESFELTGFRNGAPYYSDPEAKYYIHYRKDKTWQMSGANRFREENGIYYFQIETSG